MLLTVTQEGQLCEEGGRWRTCLLGCCHGVPGRRDLGASWQRRQGQQEDAHHSQAPAVGHQV